MSIGNQKKIYKFIKLLISLSGYTYKAVSNKYEGYLLVNIYW